MRTIIFDLDGTLVDSAPDIHAAANCMLERLGRPGLSLEQVKGFIGDGVPTLVERCLAASGGAEHEGTALSLFEEAYNAAPSTLTRVYPGVITLLTDLRDAGSRLGICTNKPENPSRTLLEDLALTGFFDAVVGGDTLLVRKPDPAPLKLCAERLGVEIGHVLYVGDSETDAATAIAAGVPFALYTGGYRKLPALDIRATFRFDAHAELGGIIERA